MGRTAAELITCRFESHAAAMIEILNESILSSTAVWEYEPRKPERMREWFDAKRAGDYPVLGAVDSHGALLGFASYGEFRAWPAYKYTVEHSVFVHARRRRAGIGRQLMTQLIAVARAQGYHVLVGAIDGANVASIALHEELGFTRAGAITEAGYKHGKWLDVVFYQLTLPTPEQPVEG